jgi:Protein of unknown function (DUF2971)
MRLYHFLPAKWALDDIKRRRLKLSRVDNLNDPFEFLSVALGDAQLREHVLGWKRQMSDKYGVICFSKASTSPVQWAHYAERHTGMCLGFDVRDDATLPVKYVRRRVMPETIRQMLNAPDRSDALEAMKKLLATKYAHWRYESEVRTFHRLDASEQGTHFAAFDDDLVLREVIVGALCDTGREEIDRALGNLTGVVAYKKRLAFKSFSVVRNRNESLWD